MVESTLAIDYSHSWLCHLSNISILQ